MKLNMTQQHSTKSPLPGAFCCHLRTSVHCGKVLMSSKDGKYPTASSPIFARPTFWRGKTNQQKAEESEQLGLQSSNGGRKVQHRQGCDVTDHQRLTELYPRFTGDRGQSDGWLQWACRRATTRENLRGLLGDLLPSLRIHQ